MMPTCKLVYAVFFVLMLASAMAQAAALEVPHVTKSHGETQTRQLGKLSMKDPSSMLTELEEMVHSGETPTFDVISVIKSTIQDDIMPGLQATRGAAANDTIDFLDAIDLCNDESKARADQIAGSTQVLVNIARSAHAVCRDAQKTMYHHNLTSPESYCVKLGKFLHETEPLSIEDGMTRADAVDYVNSNSMNSNMCARSEVCELDDNCTQKEEELRIKEVECLQKQKDFEEAFCTWKAQLELNCQELDRCHSTAQTAYQHHVDKTEILLEKWNVETAALQKILCYCNVWLSDMDDCDNRSQHNATQFDVCKSQSYNPDPVDHGTPTPKASCPLTSVICHPGKSCFSQEYSSFADFVAIVVPCLGASTAAPTTAAPTPTPAPCYAETTPTGLNWGVNHGGCSPSTAEQCEAACSASTACIFYEYSPSQNSCCLEHCRAPAHATTGLNLPTSVQNAPECTHWTTDNRGWRGYALVICDP